jgi:16S rRNA (cytosine967-C5)-methyltransferase
MIAPARVAALHVCEQVERGEMTLPEALAHANATLPDARDRALAAEIATGVFRWRAALDHAIAVHLTRAIDRVDAVVLGILRVSAYQLLFLDRVPARAVVDDAVSLTRQRKRTSASGFVNAVLRKLASATSAAAAAAAAAPAADAGAAPAAAPAAEAAAPSGGSARAALLPARSSSDYLTVTLSHPRWLIDRWIARYGVSATEAWAAFNNSNAPLTLRANTRRITREALAMRLAEVDVHTEPTRYAPDGLVVRSGHPLRTPLASSGLFVAQDEASQIVGWLAQRACAQFAAARATGSHDEALRVLDACAAPGGKTLALASVSRARVIAGDRRARRIDLLRDTIASAGLDNVRLVQLDLEAGLPFSQAFDLILVDAPCSGLGTLRREPEIRWRRTEADLPRFADRQTRMLAEAAAALRPGGILIYSTCSSEPDENEVVTASFLQTHEHCQSVPLAALDSLVNEAGHLRTLPHAHALEAFFAAAFRRIA